MSLNKDSLKTKIIAILVDFSTRTEPAVEDFADKLATAIDAYVRDAKITYTSGLTSATGGAVTGTFNGKLE